MPMDVDLSHTLKLNQLKLDLSIMHSFIFQMVLEYKQKIEVNYGSSIAHIAEEKILSNGEKQIVILPLATDSDILDVEYLANDNKNGIEEFELGALYTFDPEKVDGNTIEISLRNTNKMKSQVISSSIELKIK